MTTREKENVQETLSAVYSLYLEAQANEGHTRRLVRHPRYVLVCSQSRGVPDRAEEVKSILRKIYEVEQPF